MTLKTDITLISTPVMETRVPAPAIYYLKGSLNQHGYRSRCFDLVRDSEEHFGEQESKRVNSYLLADWHSGMHHDSNDNDIRDLVANYYRNYVRERILPLNSEWVGVSVFSQNSQKASDILCGAIREILPDTKIIIGGTGLGVQLGSNRGFADHIIDNGLADHYIDGEGELTLVELLKGNLDYPGINNTNYQQIDDLDLLPYPDYVDYKTDYGDLEKVTITGSRGCVRRCSFCDIGVFWKKFRYRSGKNIAEELIRNKKLYESETHFFSDSLINGNMKAFRELCQILADYHEQNPGRKNRIRWGGQFIVRSKSQCTANDYELMRRAGMLWASIGIESASEKVRHDMKKYFTNKDMYFSLDKLIENKMHITAMFIIGYPTETFVDYQENIKFLEYYADRTYKAIDGDVTGHKMGCIRDLNLGQTLGILPGSRLGKQDDIANSGSFWVSKVVPDLDFGLRVERRRTLSKVAKSLGYVVRWDEKQLHFLEKRLVDWKKQ